MQVIFSWEKITFDRRVYEMGHSNSNVIHYTIKKSRTGVDNLMGRTVLTDLMGFYCISIELSCL